MDAQWKDWWLRALRGGNFKQCQGRLRNAKNECCCFGVLADGMAPNTWRRQYDRAYAMGVAPYRLPESLRRQAGISLDILVYLERVNDRGWSFAKIADWIEQNL